MSIYRGFSTVNELSQKKFRLTNFDLIKQDLLNSLNTRYGSRVMRPNDGCIVWELLYEPFVAEVKEQIFENITNIINNDPRLAAESINIVPEEDKNTITIEINLRYVLENQVDRMIVTFSDSGATQTL